MIKSTTVGTGVTQSMEPTKTRPRLGGSTYWVVGGIEGVCLAHLALRRWVGGSPTPAVASGSATPAMAGEAGARLEETAQKGGQRRERSANEKKCQTSVRTMIGVFVRLRFPLEMWLT